MASDRPDPEDDPQEHAPETGGDDAGAAGEASGVVRRPIVAGIGASAGGVEALQAFFEAVPEGLGVAFVVVVHLSPEHRSELAGILDRSTHLTVQQVEDTVDLEGDCVYVIPPDRQLQITDISVGAVPFEEPRGQRAPIDTFFRSLASQHGDGFAVILSGGGSDGAVGVKAVKEAGGLILVQDPAEAAFDSMPRAAIATEVADLVLPVRGLAGRLADLTHTKRRIRETIGLPPRSEQPELDDNGEETLSRILTHLHARVGHDFSKYKRATVLRRVGRRMQVHRKETLADYLAFLRHDADEAKALFDDLLISVTTFFRDPAAWDALAEQVIPRLFETHAERDGDDPLRLWVPGCATGEEAYSLAILLLEEAGRRDVPHEVQIFASDLDEGALATAREGRYPAAVEADVSPERLRRFFVAEGDHVRVTKEVRDCVLFASHSLLRDPPFSRLDLVSCRNLLIYLDRELQGQVFGILHYALRPGGFLFLGSSESPDGALFRTLDKRHRLYQARAATAQHLPDLLTRTPRLQHAAERERPPSDPVPAADLHRALLEDLAPPSILVDENRQALHLSETAGRFLQPPGGVPTRDVTALVRPELQSEVRAALFRAAEHGEAALSSFVPVPFNGTPRRVAVLVRPRPQPDGEWHALVVFLEGGEEPGAPPAKGEATDEVVDQLRNELHGMQRRMQTTREEHDAAVEELRAANEELQSINEEYRSTAEELETSKEELQSINEELQTVNAELKGKLDEIRRAHSDLENLMAATEIGTLFLDRQLRIHRFTPRLADLFNVTPDDRGRPIADFTHRLAYDDLEADARRVLDDLSVIEREVESDGGRWFLVRLRPYRTVDDKIDGVVVTFVDVTARHEAEAARREFAEAIVETVNEPLVVLTPELRIESANPAFYETFNVTPERTEGRRIYDLGNGQWNIPTLRTLLDDVLPEDHTFAGYEVEHTFEDIGYRVMLVNGRRLEHAALLLLGIRDVTEQKATGRALQQSETRYRALFESISEGFCIVEIVRDDDGAPVDHRFVEVNPAFERHNGLKDAVGKRASELHPDIERAWTEIYARVAATGQAERFTQEEPALGRWFEVEVFRVGDAERDSVAVLFADVTERRRTVEALRRAKGTLEERVAERTEQVRALASKLSVAEQDERRRIARILHDDIQQLLFGIQLKMTFVQRRAADGSELARHAEESYRLLGQAIDVSRRLTVDLSPPILAGEGLADALEWLRTQMLEVHRLNVEVRAEHSFVVPQEGMRVLLFQIVRELLFNVVKHADTDRAVVTLGEQDGTLVIAVEDEGAGFEPGELEPDAEGGFGLFSARERLRLFGGRLEVHSVPGDGTRVVAHLPASLALGA